MPRPETVLPTDDCAGPGSVVTVVDRAGRVTDYELIAGPEDALQRVTTASATGSALVGTRPGEYVNVTLANGRQRRARVVNVTPRPAARA